MSPQRFKDTLIQRGERYALEAILLPSKPVIFSNRGEYHEWRNQIAGVVQLAPEQVFLIGSSVVGFSLAPLKFGRTFSPVATADRPASDLDVVIIDSPFFHECWA